MSNREGLLSQLTPRAVDEGNHLFASSPLNVRRNGGTLGVPSKLQRGVGGGKGSHPNPLPPKFPPTLAQLPLTVTGALRSPAVAGITVGTTNAAALLTGEDRGILRVSQVPSKAAPFAEARVISEKCQVQTHAPQQSALFDHLIGAEQN